MGMSGLPFGGRTEDRRHVVVALDIRLLRKVQITAIGLRFARKCVLEILLGAASLELHECFSASVESAILPGDVPPVVLDLDRF